MTQPDPDPLTPDPDHDCSGCEYCRPAPHEWLLVSEAAAMLGIHAHTLARDLPGLPYMRVGRRGDWRYRLVDVERYIASRMVRP